MTVSCRRSAPADAGLPGVAAVEGRSEERALVRGAPQSPQNFLPGGLSRPQARQCCARGAPQSPQNRLAS